MKCFDSLRAKLISSYVVSRGIPPEALLATVLKGKDTLFDFAIKQMFSKNLMRFLNKTENALVWCLTHWGKNPFYPEITMNLM